MQPCDVALKMRAVSRRWFEGLLLRLLPGSEVLVRRQLVADDEPAVFSVELHELQLADDVPDSAGGRNETVEGQRLRKYRTRPH